MDTKKTQAEFPLPLLKRIDEMKETPTLPIPELKPNEKVVTKFVNVPNRESKLFLLAIVIFSIIGFFAPCRNAHAVVIAYIVYLLLYAYGSDRHIHNFFLLFGGCYCFAALANLLEGSYTVLQIALVITFIDSFIRFKSVDEVHPVEFKPSESTTGNTIIKRLRDAFDF